MYRACGTLKNVLNNRGLRFEEVSIYVGIIVPTGFYGAMAWSKRSAERNKLNVLEIKSLGWVGGVKVANG